MENKSYTLAEVEEKATAFLNRKKDRNETTFLNYRTSVNYFLYYMEHIEGLTELTTDNKEVVVDGFQGKLFKGFTYESEGNKKEVKLKPSAVNTHIRRIKTFLNSIGLKIKKLKKLPVNKPEYKALDVKDIKLLLAECSNLWKKKEIAVRNETLIRFLFNTAFRINEALGIKTSDVVEEGSSYYVMIQEKGKPKGTLTEVAISEATYKMLMDYINLKAVPSDYVFSTTRPSTDGKAKKLSREYFTKDIRKLASYTDLKHGTNISATVKNNSSHFLRHSKSLFLLNVKKYDITKVKKILRHESINSTLIYLNHEKKVIDEIRISNDI